MQASRRVDAVRAEMVDAECGLTFVANCAILVAG